MGPVWTNLFWKEWREQRGKLAALTAIACGTMLVILAGAGWSDEGRPDLPFILTFTLLLYVPIASLFVGMGLAASEQASGTIRMLAGLPSPMHRVAVAKLVVGFVTTVLPALATIAAAWLAATISPELSRQAFGEAFSAGGAFFPRPLATGLWQIDVALLVAATSASLLVWVVAVSANRDDEVRAAAIALGVIAFVWGTASALLYWWAADTDSSIWMGALGQSLLAALPGGFVAIAPLNAPAFFPADRLPGPTPSPLTALEVVSVFVAVHGVLVCRWLSAYGAAQAWRSDVLQRLNERRRGAWLDAPMASPRAAIVWQTVRTCAPVVVGSLVLAAVYTALIYSIESGMGSKPLSFRDGVMMTSLLTIACGFLAALVVGVGVLLEDLRPGVNRFWRSRPISPDAWFWTKSAGGLAALAIPFGAAYLIYGATQHGTFADFLRADHRGALVFALLYTSTVAAVVVVRQPVYGAILGVCLMGMFAAPNLFEGWFSAELATSVVVLGVVLTTLAGWQAFRRDWSLAGK
ncbi:hypothetical protein [Botrimarina sp.]|uniref:hypothetical protein n=1 Tax=Botrimarina sp. TaxID=2795802 RepID=UPI0032EF150C